MSVQEHLSDTSTSNDHGTEKTYIVGFVLSLLFTFIPFSLVRSHSLTSRAMLVAILIIAAIQMIVQVVFFLHLGREKKPRWQLYFLSGTIFGIMTVVGGSIFIMAHLHHNMTPLDVAQSISQDEGLAQVEGNRTGACQSVHTEYTVTIKNGAVSPNHINAHICDGLVFVSDDSSQRHIAFGPHPSHVPYAGVDELLISRGHGQMLILSETGTYDFHDHLNPTVTGSFTVAQ